MDEWPFFNAINSNISEHNFKKITKFCQFRCKYIPNSVILDLKQYENKQTEACTDGQGGGSVRGWQEGTGSKSK